MKDILVSDPTLRDGNHAIQHRLNLQQIARYAALADAAGVPIIEVGHGNGLGASSLQVGESTVSDHEILTTARAHITRGKLGIHCIPSFATINKDLKPAIDLGVDVFRIATHCTEADVTQRQIEYLRGRGKDVYGTLMMTSHATPERLVAESKKMEQYGALGVIIMDSVGGYLPHEVTQRITALTEALSIAVGFHAHNNLGLAIANSMAAIAAGATIIDGTICGFGAGAGNAQLEVLVAVLHKLDYRTGIDLYKLWDAADVAAAEIVPAIPTISPVSIVSGLAGVFSGFKKHVERIAVQYGLDQRDIFFELGRRKIIAGQEDCIIEIAIDLAAQRDAAAANAH